MKLSSNWHSLQAKTQDKAKPKKVTKKTTSRVTKLVSKKGNTQVKKAAVQIKHVETQQAPTKQTFAQVVQYALNHDLAVPELITMLTQCEKPTSLEITDLPHPGKNNNTGKYVSMDCEFVGTGVNGAVSELARVSMVNYYGHVVLDQFVRPANRVTDWRTRVSGITARILKENNAVSFNVARDKVSAILQGRVLVGHAVHHDLQVLNLRHPPNMVRDTSQHAAYRELAKGKTPGLKKLTAEILGINIQSGQHSSVEDARATMLLFRLRRKDIEKSTKKSV